MITQSVIATTLIGIVITGLIPIIGGIALMAMGKIKASSFWAGVLAYIIAILVTGIAAVILGLAAPDMVMEGSAAYGIISSLINGVVFALAMGVCVKSCMKTRTFNAALSCGLGFAVSYAVTLAISFVSVYITFGNINSGAFDVQYAQFVKMGVFDKETVNMLKAAYTEMTVITIVQQILIGVFFAAAMAAAAVFIMRFVCTGKAFLGICAAMGTFVLYGIGSAIPNVFAAIIVTAAIGIAALIFAVRMKEQVTPPEKAAVIDPFLNSVENAKNEE
ncbi:MAG: hypothetical protein K2H90_01165 [Oscillospiraceae bacterium]|nr:hypothetical protein [Oscillospiraceae bacterium]